MEEVTKVDGMVARSVQRELGELGSSLDSVTVSS